MTTEALAAELVQCGSVLLPQFFSSERLDPIRQAALRCFNSIAAGKALPEHYRFSRPAHSLQLTALLDFGCSEADLLAPITHPEVRAILSSAKAGDWRARLDQSWARRKFPFGHPSSSGAHLQNWHQDGALGVQFPPRPGPEIPRNELLTCWVPLQSCGIDAPGLELIRRGQRGILHFTELKDDSLRRRFEAGEFWIPDLKYGDGLMFLDDVLHRTHLDPRMGKDRISIEYRFFPPAQQS